MYLENRSNVFSLWTGWQNRGRSSAQSDKFSHTSMQRPDTSCVISPTHLSRGNRYAQAVLCALVCKDDLFISCNKHFPRENVQEA